MMDFFFLCSRFTLNQTMRYDVITEDSWNLILWSWGWRLRTEWALTNAKKNPIRLTPSTFIVLFLFRPLLLSFFIHPLMPWIGFKVLNNFFFFFFARLWIFRKSISNGRKKKRRDKDAYGNFLWEYFLHLHYFKQKINRIDFYSWTPVELRIKDAN